MHVSFYRTSMFAHNEQMSSKWKQWESKWTDLKKKKNKPKTSLMTGLYDCETSHFIISSEPTMLWKEV